MKKLYKTIDEKKIIKEQEQLNTKIDSGSDVGKLFGVEIALEDNISTKDVKTEVGSKMLEGYIPPFDAEVVTRLKSEDAIIKGKIDVKEFGIGLDIKSNLGEVIKKGEAKASIGVDASGEIRNTAAKANLYGLKPSYGSVSRYGLIGSAPSLEQIGIIAEDIDTVKNIFDAISGYDKKDSTSLKMKRKKAQYTNGIKVAVVKETVESQDKDMKKTIEASIDELKAIGAEIEYVSIPSSKYAASIYNILQSAEFSSDMGKFDGVVYGYNAGEHSDNEDFFKVNRTKGFSEEVKKRIMFGNFVLREENYKEYYEKSQKIRTLIATEVEEIFSDYDIILNPIVGENIRNTVIANLVGCPALSLPSREEGFNLQIMGRKLSEATLFEFAKSYEVKSKEKEGK